MAARVLACALVLVAAMSACRSSEKRPTAGSGSGSAPDLAPVNNSGSAAAKPLDLDSFAIRTDSEANDRVRAVFPRGVATQDARAEIGTAPAPPEDTVAPDPRSTWIAELALATPLTAAGVRAALPPPGITYDHAVLVHVSSGAWTYLDGDSAGPFDRIAVTIPLVTNNGTTTAAVTAAELDREADFARAIAARLKLRPPTPSLTTQQALARAAAALAVRRRFTDDALDIGVAIVAPDGKRFAGRLMWDAVYSAGFLWGDGDYFHWTPTAKTDDSQGIEMGTSTGTGYFFPEWVTAGKADVDDLEMSFNAARTWQPTQMFGVMIHAANYLARRLGGTVVTTDGKPFDPTAELARVTAIERAMLDAGLTPGVDLALRTF